MHRVAVVTISLGLRQLTALWLLAVLLCLLTMTASSTARASHDHANTLSQDVTVTYCASEKPLQTLDQALSCEYVDYADARPMMEKSPRWVKVVAKTSQAPQTLTINVGPHFLRQVEVFDGMSGKIVGGPVGTAYPYSPEHGLLASYAFAIDLDDTRVHTYYVRIFTLKNVPYAFVQASVDPATTFTMNRRLGLGIHLGVLGLLLFISAGVYAATRTPVMGIFALVILNLLLGTMSGSGLLFKYVWPQWPWINEMFFSTMFYLRPAVWLWLAQSFLATYQTPTWYRPALQVAYALVAAMIVLVWVGWGEISSILAVVFAATIFPIGQIIAIKMTTRIRPVYQRILITGYAIGALATWSAMLLVFFPSNNPELPIQVTRIIDYAIPLILLGLVVFHYRETTLQLAATQAENVKIRLGLDLEQKLQRERKLMVDMLTHELKNPLASISMAIGSLSGAINEDNSLARRRLQNMAHSVRNMDAVIERCNLMNQLDQSALQCQPSRVCLRHAINEVLSRFTESSRVRLQIDGADAVIIDPQFFQMVISNLIDNALKYSPPNTVVTMHVMHQQTATAYELCIDISNPIGDREPPEASMVFTRFYRQTAAQKTSGSGVGLYLAQALARLMGGEIRYRPAGDHVTFRLEISGLTVHE